MYKILRSCKTLAILGFICISHFSYGQIDDITESSTLKKQIPTSPEASALGKYGDIPVGLYTGVPNVNIPIYTMKIKDFELPIGLSYNSSGIKVEEVATNTGLGWVLNAGGSMSVSVNGLRDVEIGGLLYPESSDDVMPSYILSPANLAYNGTQNGGGVVYQFAKKAASGAIDTQPDLFSYSIPGSSGKFYFDPQGQVHPVPFSAIKIVHLGHGGFNITDEKGRIFTFEAQESSVMENNCGAPAINNTAFLSKIQLPDGNVITLNYTSINYSYNIQRNFSRKRVIPGYASHEFFDCVDNGVNTLALSGKRLSGIASTAGHNIQFIYTNNRLDLPGTQSLDKILINSQAGLINSFDFSYGYFGGPSGNASRLKLLAVKSLDGAKHSFDYNETISIPNRLSFSQDHWGYFNGKNNSTLLPLEPDYGFMDGANREVDSAYSQMGILKQINYPTGGFSRFNYEQNDYFFVGNETSYIPQNYSAYGRDYETVTTTFTVPEMALPGGVNQIGGTVYFNDGSGPVIGHPGDEPVDGTNQLSISGNGFYQVYYNQLSPNGRIGITLKPGTYTISVASSSIANGAYCTVAYQAVTSIPVQKNKLIGGIRIKNIVSKTSSDGVSEIKQYRYRQQAYPERSSGNVNFYPLYTTRSSRYSYKQAGLDPGPAECRNRFQTPFYTDYWKQTANSVYPTGSIKGGTVGYTFVTNLYGSNAENGKTESTFSFVHNSGGSLSSPLVPFIDNDWKNGFLEKEVQYRNQNGNFQPVSKVQSFYSVQPETVFWNSHYLPATYNPNALLRGRGVVIEYKRDEQLCELTLFPAEFRVNDFRYESEWLRLDSSRSLNYHYNPLIDSVQTSNQLMYGNPAHLQPTTSRTLTSAGSVVQKTMRYPQDYVAGTSIAIDSLVARHQISTPLMQETNNNSFVSTTNHIYKNWSPKITAPEYIQNRTGSNPLENRIQYYGYDDRSNALSLGQSMGPKTNYIWSYQKTVPIAEIKNADYNTVVAVLGGAAAVDAFANKSLPTKAEIDSFLALLGSPLLEDAHVSKFTYDPLVGMLTATDVKGQVTFYDYDVSKRLIRIRDQNGHIIKSYEYNYQH